MPLEFSVGPRFILSFSVFPFPPTHVYTSRELALLYIAFEFVSPNRTEMVKKLTLVTR